MTKHGRVLAILSVPRLTPIKLELEMLGQILLQVVMHTLYEHGLEAHLFEQIGHGGRIAERVNGPAMSGLYGRINIGLEPFVAQYHLLNDRIVVRVGLVCHHPSACDYF